MNINANGTNSTKHGNRHNRGDRRDVQTIHDHAVKLGATCGYPKSKEVKLSVTAANGLDVPIDLVVQDDNGTIYLRVEEGGASFDDLAKVDYVNCPNGNCERQLMIAGKGHWRCMACNSPFYADTQGAFLTAKQDQPVVIPPAEVVK